MAQMKTPGVYIVEKNAFPNSVVEVATAVPAFIGHTETCSNGGKSLLNKPWRITSIAEYHKFYGGAPDPLFEISESSDGNEDLVCNGTGYNVNQSGGMYILYYSMLMFFQNGGGACYIVSIGDYKTDLDPDRFSDGIKQLIKEQEPTMVVIPEAILLAEEDCISVQQASLQHCGYKMKNRISILDVYDGYKDRQDPSGDCVENFRDKLGTNFLDFAAAYYPWVNTNITHEKEIGFTNFANRDKLTDILEDELVSPLENEIASILDDDPDKDAKSKRLQDTISKQNSILKNINVKPAAPVSAPGSAPKGKTASKGKNAAAPSGTPVESAGDEGSTTGVDISVVNKALFKISPVFNKIIKEIVRKLNLLPPGAAMAGIYTMVDNDRGVWKAPANVSLNSVVDPAVNITNDDQEDLNVPIDGKTVNAIRSFIGEGTLAWGARTLDGNSLDWRYINVRRTIIMLEESVRLASKAYVFENNDANTWVTVKSMISNFLTGIWKRGGLAGTIPQDAFSVHVGLGETMTADDILEGILRVTILVALIHPAEFIEITFQQQLQKS
ncbi:MAG: phage tail sheath family protein [Planctomycetes bacterium]|nr:phage tail sheath family protein [Planctomycetota bacterium]